MIRPWIFVCCLNDVLIPTSKLAELFVWTIEWKATTILSCPALQFREVGHTSFKSSSDLKSAFEVRTNFVWYLVLLTMVLDQAGLIFPHGLII